MSKYFNREEVYSHRKKPIRKAKVTRIVSRRYGSYDIGKTRVILMDPQGMWAPTKTYPVWGSEEGVVGTVYDVSDDNERLYVAWDNGTKSAFYMQSLTQYSEKKHGKPMNDVRPGPNTSFKMIKNRGG